MLNLKKMAGRHVDLRVTGHRRDEGLIELLPTWSGALEGRGLSARYNRL